MSGPIWTLIAIDSHNYQLPEVETGKTQTTRELLVKTILDMKTGDGWTFSGNYPDVDMTCMAIQALAPYGENPEVAEAIDKAVKWISERQSRNGGFVSYGNESSESASQVIAALAALAIVIIIRNRKVE